MLVFTVAGPVDASDSELPSSIVISEGEDDKGSEACVGCKVAGGLSVQGVLPFPLDPRAIVTVVPMFACCFAEEKWNKDVIEADENLIS